MQAVLVVAEYISALGDVLVLVLGGEVAVVSQRRVDVRLLQLQQNDVKLSVHCRMIVQYTPVVSLSSISN